MASFPTAPHHSNKKDVEKLTRVADYSRGLARCSGAGELALQEEAGRAGLIQPREEMASVELQGAFEC